MKELIEKITKRQVILFVGAGISATLGLPTWNKLMDYVALSLNIDPCIYKLYGDNLSLAEYYKLKKGTIGPLRSWMDKTWHIPDSEIMKSEILKLICDMHFPIVYTTNFDNCLERAYGLYNCEYTKITKVEDICEINNSNLNTQLIKFHGDFEDDDSIVLTESSYFKRMDFESPLDIKLRSDSLGRSILFIGYSLSDINIRYLIYKLNKLWSTSDNQKLKPKSYIFLDTPNPVQELILESRDIIPIIGEDSDPTANLLDFLKRIKPNVTYI